MVTPADGPPGSGSDDWDDVAQHVRERAERSDPGARVLYPEVLRLAGRLKGKTALDLGGPEGALVRLLGERGARALGAEGLERPSALPRGPFDLITAVRILDPATKPVAALGTLARLLRPGGRLVLGFDHPYQGPAETRPLEALFASLRDVGLRVVDLTEPRTEDDPPRRFLVMLCERRQRRLKNRGTRRKR